MLKLFNLQSCSSIYNRTTQYLITDEIVLNIWCYLFLAFPPNVQSTSCKKINQGIINRTVRTDKNLVSKHFIDLKHAHMADRKSISLLNRNKRNVENDGSTTDVAKCSNPFWVLRVPWEGTWSSDRHLLASTVVLGLLQIYKRFSCWKILDGLDCDQTITKCISSLM